jgi:pyruvate kinase
VLDLLALPPLDAADPALRAIANALDQLRAECEREEQRAAAALASVHPVHAASARNLVHYLALRRHDLRPLQQALAQHGLSSLGRAESHVLAALDAVRAAVAALLGESAPAAVVRDVVDAAAGARRLEARATALLGPAPSGRTVRIMVTMPREAADDPRLAATLCAAGMDLARINCAHDTAAEWTRMVAQLREAARRSGRPLQVAMDLAGPKLRTGPVEAGPPVVHVRPARDPLGRDVAPARIWLTTVDQPAPPPSPADAVLPVEEAWLTPLVQGDTIEWTDTRDRRRAATVADRSPAGAWLTLGHSTWITTGTVLRRRPASATARPDVDGVAGRLEETKVGPLPTLPQGLRLHEGDVLVVTRDLAPGRPATRDAAGWVLTPAQIGCTLPAALDAVQPGEAIWFDDGAIGGIIEQVEPTAVRVRITQARAQGATLRADRGINLPDSALALDALTPDDRAALPVVVAHADLVQLSFASQPEDVHRCLAALGDATPGLVLKIETRRGFEQLPALLLAAMRHPRCGVMIARGDLAVECGFERLAEVQEEILWLCEAAHVPVIWATQVLESLAKTGQPSRAEITDAAMGDRAECVMLNKGPHIVEAVRMLDGILRRMQAHHVKKRSMLRPLRLARGFLDAAPD